MKQQGLDPSMLNDIMRRIVEVAQPERIILFGSAARREMGPRSDVDLLIVKEAPNLRKLTARVYRRLYGVGAAVDIVMATPPGCGAVQGQPRAGHQARPAGRKSGV